MTKAFELINSLVQLSLNSLRNNRRNSFFYFFANHNPKDEIHNLPKIGPDFLNVRPQLYSAAN